MTENTENKTNGNSNVGIDSVAVLDNIDQIRLYQMKVQKSALRLEILGLKSRGGSVAAAIRKMYNLTGAKKQDLLDKFTLLIEQREHELEYQQSQE